MSPTPDTFVAEYRLLEEIARGGQGAVFRALRADGAQVALKVLLDGEPESLARFEREALGLARVQHPNVVKVHDYGLDGRKPYLVMEWIEGETLSERVRRQGPLSAPEAVKILGEVASALSHCHSLGIVHRDLKPQNVVLQAERGAVLVDFGLVREVGSGGGELAQRLTVTGEVLGTPSYMAPEQADAGFGEVSSASDVYALGATLYFALTGYPPLELRGGLLAALVELLEGAPPDPRARQPQVPDALAALCLRSLAKRPQERPPDAAGFLAELRGGLGPAPASAAALRPWVLGAAALLPVLVVAGLSMLALKPAPPPSRSSPSPEFAADSSPAGSRDPTLAPSEAAATPSITVAPSARGPSVTRLGLIKRHLFVENYDQAWQLVELDLAQYPENEELLSLGLVALRAPGKSRPDKVVELLCRLQAQAPREERIHEIGLALRAYARTQPPAEEEERWLARAIAAFEGAPSESETLRFEHGNAYVRRADLHFQAERWQAAGEAAARGEALLTPPAERYGSTRRRRLARAIEVQFSAAVKFGSPTDELLRLEKETATKLLALCADSPEDRVPRECLARVHSYASNMDLAREEQIARAEASAAAFLEVHRLTPAAQASRDNYKVYALVQLARSARIRRQFPEAVEVLESGFSLAKVTRACRVRSLNKAYLNQWEVRLRWGAEADGGREALREALAERPWASDRPEDQGWIEDLERKLRALLGS